MDGKNIFKFDMFGEKIMKQSELNSEFNNKINLLISLIQENAKVDDSFDYLIK